VKERDITRRVDLPKQLVILGRTAADGEGRFEEADGGQARETRTRPRHALGIDQVAIDLAGTEWLGER
jgi:hypothetical protein